MSLAHMFYAKQAFRRAMRWAKQWRQQRRHAHPSRPFMLEALEPRLLMSADFNPVAPVGGLVHVSSQSGQFAMADSDISYTLSLDAGQRVSVAFTTQDADLQGRIQLYDVDGVSVLGEVSASSPGGAARLDSVLGAGAGDYRLVFHNLAGDGAFEADIVLNATLELEATGGSNNNDLASAQSLAPSELTLPGGGLRYAAVGTAEAGAPDFYRLDLNTGEHASFGLAATVAGAGGALRLELQDAVGNLLVTGDSDSPTVDRYIKGFTPAASGTFYARITGDDTGYSLLVTRDADFDLEIPNQDQSIAVTHTVLGYIGGLGGGDAGTGPSGSTSPSRPNTGKRSSAAR